MKAFFRKIILIRDYLYTHQLIIILYFGILLRIIIFIFQRPLPIDDHFGVVRYIYEQHSIPTSNVLSQSYHPPLYYVLASFFFPGGIKIIQTLSLILSMGTLLVIYWLIKNLEFIQPLKTKKYCLLLACTLPQFIICGNYISNDILSFFIGALIFFQIFKYINKPNAINQNSLAIYLGLGLLTKGTFLLFIPAMILLVIIINIRKKIGLKQSIIFLSIFIAIFTILGSYKYIQNIIHWGRPIVINLDANPEWMDNQRHTYAGLRSFYDVNIFKLCRHPISSKDIRHSYPLMLYGSFWEQSPLYKLGKLNKTVLYLRSLIYIFAMLPTLLFFIGFLRILFSVKCVFSLKQSNVTPFNKITYETISLFLFLSNLLAIIYLGAKYDIWSVFHSRLLFPSFFPFVILFNSGLDYVRSKWPIVQKAVYQLLGCLYLLFVMSFSIEIAYGFPYLKPLIKFFI